MEEKIRNDAEVYRKIAEENRDLSYNDQLTSLLNRNAFSKKLRCNLKKRKKWIEIRLGLFEHRSIAQCK